MIGNIKITNNGSIRDNNPINEDKDLLASDNYPINRKKFIDTLGKTPAIGESELVTRANNISRTDDTILKTYLNKSGN